MRDVKVKVGIGIIFGLIVGATLFGSSSAGTAPAAPTAPVPAAVDDAEMSQLQARVAMVAVDYHASNLWFAGKAENWPLADYYWKQTLSHIRLSVQLKGTPDRPGQPGNQARLADIARAIETSPNTQVGAAIERKDLRGFLVSYRTLLEGCYSCHKAADLPFLRPRMPAPPASSIITVDANAPWPK